MKARLPQGYGGGGAANLQQLARQAQKMQEQMDAATTELEAKEYTATSGGSAVSVTVTGRGGRSGRCGNVVGSDYGCRQ